MIGIRQSEVDLRGHADGGAPQSAPAPTPRRPRRSGFTVIELVVVIAILSIMSVLSVGAYLSYRNYRQTRAGAQSVSAIFNAARNYAITTNKWHRVVFQFRNPGTNDEEVSFWVDEIFRRTSPNAFPATAAELVSGVTKPKVTTPEFLNSKLRISDIGIFNDVSLTTGSLPGASPRFAVVRFKPDGTSDAATVYVVPRAADPTQSQNYYTVKLYQPTAKSKIFAETRR